MRASKWIFCSLGALFGAGLWPLFAWLVFAVDEASFRAQPLLVELVGPVWIILGMPGVVLENRGYLTLAFLMTFWAVVGACMARIGFFAYEGLLSMLSMCNEAPFADRGKDSRED